MAQYYIKEVIRSVLNRDIRLDSEEFEGKRGSDENYERQSTGEGGAEGSSTTLDLAGFRSPLLTARGRSIKELEEQLSSLRKENFNLKLRIYFLEERMGSNFNLDQESAIKKNIELSVEVESLRKEIDEKQDLLVQAVKAMELEEEEHRKQHESMNKELKHVQAQLDGLQQQYDLLQEVRSQTDLNERDFFGNVMHLPDDPHEIITHMESRITDLELQLRIAQQASESPQITVDQLRTQLREKDDKLSEAASELVDKCAAVRELQSKIGRLESDLEARQRDVEKMSRRVEQKVADVKEMQCSVTQLQRTCDERMEMYEIECKRNERNRVAIANRNAKIGELEAAMEKYKAQAGALELQLATAANEVALRGASPHADYSPASRALIGKSARLAASPTKKGAAGDDAAAIEEAGKLRQKIGKLEQEQMKACRIIQTMLETRKKNVKEIEELQRSVVKRDALIEEMRAQKKSAGGGKSIQERVSELNLTAAAPSTDTEHNFDDGSNTQRLLEQYRVFTTELEHQKQILVDTLKEKHLQMGELEAKYDEMQKELREKENRIIALELEVLSAHENDSMSSIREKVDVGTEKVSFWIKESEEKDKEIEKLEKELAKRTSDLQTVVNKELWQKNREIEHLQKFIANYEKRDAENAKLAPSNDNELMIKVQSLNLQLDLKTRELELVDKQVKNLDAQCTEAQQACLILGTRLEELAAFLNNLLKQKSVLGLLGSRQNRWIRQRIDESLDLSKSLSTSLQFNSEQSLMQLTSISGILNNTTQASADFSLDMTRINPDDDVSLTYQSKKDAMKDDQSEVIRVLRLQVQELKGEIELRDNEIQKMSQSEEKQSNNNNTARKRDNFDHSDSESWSEPDRSVSKARIGLDDRNLKPKAKMSESTEGDGKTHARTPPKKSPASNECRSMVSMINEQIAQYEQLIRDKDVLLDHATAQSREFSDRYSELLEKYESVCEKCKSIEFLEEKCKSLESAHGEEKIRCDALRTENEALEKALRTAQEARTAAETEIILLNGKIENLDSYKTMLAESMDAKAKFIQNRLNELEVEKTNAQQETKVAEAKLEEALKEITRITDKLLSLEVTHAKSAANLVNEAEKEADKRVKEMELQFAERNEYIERNAQVEIERVHEQYESKLMNYVDKAHVERLTAMINELEPLQEVLRLSEQKCKQLEAAEVLVKQQLFDCECALTNKVNKLRQELDAATLHCSQLQLDKTKAEEDSAELHMQLRDYAEREDMFESQVADLKKDFAQLKDNFKRQLNVLETEKAHLKLKLTTMEAMKNDLQDHVLKLQTMREPCRSQSAPSSPTGKILNLYLSKSNLLLRPSSGHAGDPGSNYASELFANMCNLPLASPIIDTDEAERLRANTSPDLGIESDQGRFSSLEQQLGSQPPAQIDKNQRYLIPSECNNDHCVRAVNEMNTENHVLKKKLHRSNKLLEDTLAQLAKANQRKREVEKNIFKQIHKTSQVLKMAKANLDSGSETELVRK